MKMMKRPKLGHPRAGFLPQALSTIGGVASFFSNSKGQGTARRKNEELLNEIRGLFDDSNTAALGGEKVVQEGQEQALSYKDWYKENVPEGWKTEGVGGWNPRVDYEKYVKDFVPSDQVTENVQGDFGKALETLFSRRDVAQQGFDKAAGKLSGAADASRRNTMDAGQQNQAQAVSRAVSTGRYNTSWLDNASRGVAAQTSRQLAEIDSSLASLEADLEQRRTGVDVGLMADIANLFVTQAGFRADQAQALAASLAGTTYTSTPTNFGGLFDSLSDLFSGPDTRPNPYGADSSVYGPL